MSIVGNGIARPVNSPLYPVTKVRVKSGDHPALKKVSFAENSDDRAMRLSGQSGE